MGKFIDLTGQKIGQLLVLERAEKHISPCGHIENRWKCICDCGNETIVAGSKLNRKITKSCGCLAKSRSKETNIKHGKRHTRLYRIWSGIKTRCCNLNDRNYYRYGGRGITVCDEWLNSFQTFYDWSMANGYQDNLTIDRVDNNKGYSPSNCRWVTAKEQANNTRANRLIEYNGKKQTLKQLAEEQKISYPSLWYRLKHNWSIKEALNTP